MLRAESPLFLKDAGRAVISTAPWPVLYAERQAVGGRGRADGSLTSCAAQGLVCTFELLRKAGENMEGGCWRWALQARTSDRRQEAEQSDAIVTWTRLQEGR